MGTYKMCMCITRKFMVTEAQPPPDVKEAFSKFSDAGKQMAAEQLLQFLVQFQGDTSATISDAERIIDRILQQRHHIAKFTRRSLTLDDFYHYLFSQDINAPIKSQVHQDMNAPLSHYFIYSSHNSYLTGNQLSSDSSDIPIIKALQRGVRGIELDMWPNSDKDDVLVLHGKTLTSPVTLTKCLRSIKEHAFFASPYPVILTLEDHLTPELQDKVAQMVTQIFGELLFYPDSEYLEEFPSPDALKYKIILSTKPPKEYLKEKGHKKEENDLHKRKDSSDEETWGTDVAALTSEPQADDKSGSDENEDIQYDEEIDDPAHKSCQLETPEYRRLIAIHAGKPKGSLKDWLKVEQGKVRRLSLSEQAFENATTSHGTDLVRFTQNNILRIYPKTTRFDSSNYNPITGWLHGAQMVAFNMQGCGRLLWWMHGMFKSNGGCGFVKKPDFLMTVIPQDKVFDPKAVLPVKKVLKVKVYMGDGWRWDFKQEHFDTYSPPDFYTKVGIAGVPADVARHKTKITEDNWIPIWDEEFTFPLTVPELAVLRIEVHEYDMSEKDDFGGQTCLPVSELRSGIRAVSLYNSKGEKFNSVRLLMRFEFV